MADSPVHGVVAELAVVFRRSAIGSAGAAAGLVVAFAQQVVLARQLGPTDKGSLFLIVVGGAALGALAGLSLGPALQYEIGRHGATARAARHALTVQAGAVAGAAAVVVVAVTGSDLRAAVVAVGVLTVAECTIAGAAPVLVSVDRVSAKTTADIFAAAATTLALVLVLPGLDDRLAGALALVAAGRAATALAYLALLGRGPSGAVVPLRRALGFGLRHHSATVLARATKRVDVYLLAWLLDARAVGVYSVASGLAELPMLLARSAHPAAVSSASSSPETAARVTASATSATAGLLAVTLPPFAVVIVVAMEPIFGSSFADATAPFVVLCLATLGLSLYTVVGSYFVGTGRPGELTIALAPSTALNLLGSLLLIPLWGIVGNAAASVRRSGRGRRHHRVPLRDVYVDTVVQLPGTGLAVDGDRQADRSAAPGR